MSILNILTTCAWNYGLDGESICIPVWELGAIFVCSVVILSLAVVYEKYKDVNKAK
jgi:hypothetical protein